ncbi:MAG: thiamine pyrophosphate-dependent enzyme [Candidatus Thorarchaeota archaeon]
MADSKLPHRDYASGTLMTWCPGCGDFGVLYAIQTALKSLKIDQKDVLVSSGIGCSSNLPHFMNTYGFHGIHGRSLPFAAGAKLGNRELTVIATGGDGDGYGIGVGHFVHACRRNIDFTYIIMNNQIYGLTTGQVSPTSEIKMRTKTTPKGNIESPINPLALALASGASFVARGYTGHIDQLIFLAEEAIKHKGFALLDVISPCVTYNRKNTYDFFAKRAYSLQKEGHATDNLEQAVTKAYEWGERIPLGLFYQKQRPTYDELDFGTQHGPLKDRAKPLENPDELFKGYT